ncbi:hypothetical protein PRIC1_004562 [Phytophthora ramorum]
MFDHGLAACTPRSTFHPLYQDHKIRVGLVGFFTGSSSLHVPLLMSPDQFKLTQRRPQRRPAFQAGMEAKHHVVVGNPLNVKVQQTINHCVIDQATAYSSPCSTSASSAAASSLCGTLGQH